MRGEIGSQIIKTKHHIGGNALPIGNPQRGDDTAVSDDVERRTGPTLQGVEFDTFSGGKVSKVFDLHNGGEKRECSKHPGMTTSSIRRFSPGTIRNFSTRSRGPACRMRGDGLAARSRS